MAKKALNQGQRLGSERVGRAITLIADADLDVRGRTGLPPDLVLDVLVARLSRLVPSRRAGRGRSARRRLGSARQASSACSGSSCSNWGFEGGDPAHQPGLAVGRLVLVDDALAAALSIRLTASRRCSARSSAPCSADVHRHLGPGPQLRAHGLVPDAASLVLTVALDLAGDIGHVRVSRRRSAGNGTSWPGAGVEATGRGRRRGPGLGPGTGTID